MKHAEERENIRLVSENDPTVTPNGSRQWQHNRRKKMEVREATYQWGKTSADTRPAKVLTHMRDELSRLGVDVEWNFETGNIQRLSLNDKGAYLRGPAKPVVPRSWM